MKKMPITFTAIVLCTATAMALMAGCSKSSDSSSSGGGGSACGTVAASFSANVLPLVQTKCAINSGCHASGATNSGGVLTTYAQISGKASIIRSQVNSGQMPQGGTLTTAEKNTIICWVDAGAPNN